MSDGRRTVGTTALVVAALNVAACTPVATRPAPAPDHLSIVYGFGRGLEADVPLDTGARARVDAAFASAAPTPAIERGQIRSAIAILEQIAGARTPTGDDLGANATSPGSIGQMDCANEAANTTTYLRWLQMTGRLRHHRVHPPVLRAPRLVDPHVAACIEEVATGRRYVVDSWFLANGRPPFVQPVEAWRRLDPFPPQGDDVSYLDLEPPAQR